MTKEEKIKYYTIRIEDCERMMENPRTNTIKIRNYKKNWEYRLNQTLMNNR